jgi:hypothetical protein
MAAPNLQQVAPIDWALEQSANPLGTPAVKLDPGRAEEEFHFGARLRVAPASTHGAPVSRVCAAHERA